MFEIFMRLLGHYDQQSKDVTFYMQTGMTSPTYCFMSSLLNNNSIIYLATEVSMCIRMVRFHLYTNKFG